MKTSSDPRPKSRPMPNWVPLVWWATAMVILIIMSVVL
jgi:hypothetical protein